MNECTEKTGRWPNEPTDVSPDELDAFLVHAGTCEFHAEKLRAEEEELRSVFRLARGLDGHGRILHGKELRKTIAEHTRRRGLWQAGGYLTILPLKRIYLSNAGEDISGSGKFSYFLGYESDHPLLDPHAGLQVWGVFESEGETEEVLLGFYPLAGIRHAGQEEFLPLNNGYTVGLTVDQLGERHFKLKFRCVEDAVLEREQNDSRSLRSKAMKIAAGAASAGKSLLDYAGAGMKKCLPLPTSYSERIAMVIVAVLFLTGVVGADRRSPYRDVITETPLMVNPQPEMPVVKGGPPGAAKFGGLLSSAFVNSAPRVRSVAVRKSASSERREVKPPRAGSTGGSKPILEDDRRSPERNGDNPVGMVAMADVISQAESCDSNCNQLWRVHSALYTIAAADGQRVVHIGRDESLREKLVAEINQRNLDAESLNGTGPSVLHEFTITWNIIRLENSVTVQADLSADGTTKRFTFSSDGICLDHACEKAVKNAVTVVYAIMRDQSHPWAEKLT